MFITNLLVIIKNWKQPKYPSAGLTNHEKFIQWKLLTVRRKKLLTHETTWLYSGELCEVKR